MTSKLTNAERFVNTYNRLDSYMRKEVKTDNYIGHSSLIDLMVNQGYSSVARHTDILKQFAKLRNAIVHNPKDHESYSIAEPHDSIVQEYENIYNQIKNPPLAIEHLAIPSGKIYTTSLDSNVLEVIDKMKKNHYTHVPILENDILVGVFSENTIFSYVAENHMILVENDTKIWEYSKFTPIHKHTNELFMFAHRGTTVFEIEDIFREQYKDNKRVESVFITENGKENEKILGLITPWDVATYDD